MKKKDIIKLIKETVAEKRKFYELEKMWSEPIAKDRLSV